jgi:UDPglucose 6-dehydrogenase
MIIGAGCVGEATGDGFKRLGNNVVFYDIDDNKKTSLLKKGFHVFDKNRDSADDVDIFFICVEEWNVDKVFEEWHDSFSNGVVVVRSTVPPGTCRRLSEKHGFTVFHNPEFLRERNALEDFLYPDKIVIGADIKTHYDVDDVNQLKEVYHPFNAPIIIVDTITSEFLKLASNAVLSSYISIWNQLGLIAGKLGVNSHEVAKIIVLDPRISKYGTIHGKKFGGFCLPKDLKTLSKVAQDIGVNWTMLDAIRLINEIMPE